MLDWTDEEKSYFYSSGYFKGYRMEFIDLYTKDDVPLVIDNDTLYSESVKIKQSLSDSEEFTIGGCNASSIEFQIGDALEYDFVGKTFYLEMYVMDEDYLDYADIGFTPQPLLKVPMGVYRIASAKLTDDMSSKTITAYDALYDMNVSVSNWWKDEWKVIAILPNITSPYDTFGYGAPVTTVGVRYGDIYIDIQNLVMDEWIYTTVDGSLKWQKTGKKATYDGTTTYYDPKNLKEFRESLLSYFNIPYVDQNLPNDEVVIYKEKLSVDNNMFGQELLRNAIILSGGFGNINRKGKFEVVYCKNAGALYPHETLYPEDKLFPLETSESFIGEDVDEPHPDYKTVVAEEFSTEKITGLKVTKNGNEVLYGTDENLYIINQNCLLNATSISNEQLQEICAKIYEKINNISFVPNTTTLQFLPYLELGDSYALMKKTLPVNGYILSRTITGINNCMDEYVCQGKQFRDNEVSLYDEVSNIKEQTAEIGTIRDDQKKLRSDFEKTAGKILLQVENDGVVGAISLNGESYDKEVHLDLSATKININSDNFKVSELGEVECNAINITGGNINIVTTDATKDEITLNYKKKSGLGYKSSMTPTGISVEQHSYSTDYETGEEKDQITDKVSLKGHTITFGKYTNDVLPYVELSMGIRTINSPKASGTYGIVCDSFYSPLVPKVEFNVKIENISGEYSLYLGAPRPGSNQPKYIFIPRGDTYKNLSKITYVGVSPTNSDYFIFKTSEKIDIYGYIMAFYGTAEKIP